MIHSKIPRRLAFVATLALVGSALAASSAAAQGDMNVCDGQFDGPVTLNVTLIQGSHPEPYQESVDAFNAGPGADQGITVKLNYIPETEYETSIVSMGASGALPDFMYMDGPFLYNFAWNGFLRPIDSCISQDMIDGFLPSIITQGTYKDQLYSLGDFDSGLGLWVHKGMLDEVGARIPTGPDDAWTVEEFTQILKDLQAAGKGANGPLDIKWAYGAGEWRPYGFAPMIWSAGGDLIDRSTMASVEGFFNGPPAVSAWTTFQGWVNDGLIDLVAEDDSNVTVGPDGQPNTGDETPISWVGHWMYPLYSENIDDLLLLPLPDFGNGSKTGMGSWNWAVTNGPDGVANSGDEVDMDAAWAFMEWLMTPSEIERIAGAEGAVPSTNAVLSQDPLFVEGGPEHMYVINLKNAHTDTTLHQSGAVPRPATPAYGVIRDAFSDSMADIVAGADVKSTLDAAAQKIDQEIQDAGYAE